MFITRRVLIALCIVSLASGPAWAKDRAPEKPPKPRIEMAILLDTSGSMSGLINQARAQLWKVVNEFATASRDGQAPSVYVALYEYGKDSLPAEEGYMRMIVPLTDDLDRVSEELFKLTTNGGSEYCGQAIDQATRELAWSKSNRDLKCIFIAGNEPFTQGPIPFRDACHKAASAGITVSTIFCGDHNLGIRTQWAEGAKLADGSYMSINQNQVVQSIDAPQDAELTRLSSELNKTYVAYGTLEAQQKARDRQAAQDQNAAKSAPASASARAAFKGSHLYSNAGWDLVDACRLGKVKLEEIPEDQLPESLKKLSKAERKKFVEAKQKQRIAIQEKIQELSAERSKYIATELKKQQAEGDNSLDKAIIDAARSQALKKEFNFSPPTP